MTDHEIDELAKREWTHEELVAWGILPLTQREAGSFLGVCFQRVQQIERKALRKLTINTSLMDINRHHWDELADAEDEHQRRKRLVR